MPRQSRIDAPGALHHIIARGIGRRNIFNDNQDRDNFVTRLQTVLEQSRTGCYAWALIPNSPAAAHRRCAGGHHDASSFNRPRGHLQPPASAQRPSVPKSL